MSKVRNVVQIKYILYNITGFYLKVTFDSCRNQVYEILKPAKLISRTKPNISQTIEISTLDMPIKHSKPNASQTTEISTPDNPNKEATKSI